jgi:hypothetical protein
VALIYSEAAKKKSAKPKRSVLLEDTEEHAGPAVPFVKKKAKPLGYIKPTKTLGDLA